MEKLSSLLKEQGDIDSYSNTFVQDGFRYEVKTRKELASKTKVEEPTGNAIITHTGAYGQKKFIFEGQVWQCWSPSLNNSRIITAILESEHDKNPKTRCISISGLTFNRTDWEEMHNLFIKKADKEAYWLSVEDHPLKHYQTC